MIIGTLDISTLNFEVLKVEGPFDISSPKIINNDNDENSHGSTIGFSSFKKQPKIAKIKLFGEFATKVAFEESYYQLIGELIKSVPNLYSYSIGTTTLSWNGFIENPITVIPYYDGGVVVEISFEVELTAEPIYHD